MQIILIIHTNDYIRPLLVKLPKLNRIIKSCEKKYMYFMADEKHGNILNKNSEIQRIKEPIRKDFNAEATHKKHTISNTKSFKNEIKTYFNQNQLNL